IVDKDETKQRTSRYVRPETVGNFMGISIYVNIVSESSDQFHQHLFLLCAINGKACQKFA
ncbi:hypothetical protein WUBG_17939, partial [Wuchereria bancrofti]